jgi:Protein of unknown function (DUF2752)
LLRNRVNAIVPPPISTTDAYQGSDEDYPEREWRRAERNPALGWWVRSALLGIMLGLIAVFVAALWIYPYDQDGKAYRMSTHTQLGLRRCTAEELLGIPCPACGMTTSFSLLIRGDVLNSMRANCVGTLLAVFCLTMIPWCLFSAIRNRALLVSSVEYAMIAVLIILLLLMLLRWVIVVGLLWLTGSAPRM